METEVTMGKNKGLAKKSRNSKHPSTSRFVERLVAKCIICIMYYNNTLGLQKK